MDENVYNNLNFQLNEAEALKNAREWTRKFAMGTPGQ